MTESNPVQVTLSDDGIRINAVTDQAKSTDQDVKNLYDPNMMSVIEKQGTTARFAGETSRYNVLLERAKSLGIDTKELESAYANLNSFMGSVIGTGDKASDIDRDKYAAALSDFNNQMALMENKLQASYDTDIANTKSDVAVASQVASNADIVSSQAAITGDNASQVASQAYSAATVAQIAGDNATSVANTASQAASGAVIVGSTAVVTANKAITVASQAQIAGNNATSVANSASQAASNAILAGSTATASANKASADYQTLSAGVKDGSVVHITTETVIDKEVIGTAEIANGAITNAQIGKEAVGSAQIAELAVGTAQIGDGAITNAKIGKLAVGTAQIANGAITNAQIGSLAVGTANIKDAAISSAKIASLAVGTAQIGDGAITNAKIGKLAVGTAQIANAAITDAQVGNLSANKLTAGTIDANVITVKNLNASNITTGKIGASHIDVGSLSALSANIGKITTGTLEGVDIVARTFSNPNGTFTTDDKGNITATSLSLIGNKNFVYNSELLGNAAGWSLTNGGHVVNNSAHAGTLGINWNSTTNGAYWVQSARSKLMPVNYSNDRAFSSSAWLLVRNATKGTEFNIALRFWDSSLNQVGADGTNYISDGNYHDWNLLTVENLVMPSTASYVSIDYNVYNGSGDFTFSQPMINQGSKYQGYTSDTGNILSAGQVILDNNGTLTTTYDGVDQDSNNHYHAWKLNTGTLKIGSGYIVANSNGSRTIDGATQNVGNVQSTLSASYIKFTSATGGRAYMDADLISLSTGDANDTFVVNSNGVHIKGQGMEITGGLDGSSTWAQFGGIKLGAANYVINSPSNNWIYFEQGSGKGNALETIVAANLSSSSQLSKKKTVVAVQPNGNVVANTSLATYLYKGENNTHGLHMGPIIDDVNDERSYYIAPEIMALDGETIDINKATFYGWSAIKALQRENEQLQIRVRKMEIEMEDNINE